MNVEIARLRRRLARPLPVEESGRRNEVAVRHHIGDKEQSGKGVKDFTDATTGYTIVEADSHDEAVQIFSRHPHLGLFAGNSIAVLEFPPPPG